MLKVFLYAATYLIIGAIYDVVIEETINNSGTLRRPLDKLDKTLFIMLWPGFLFFNVMVVVICFLRALKNYRIRDGRQPDQLLDRKEGKVNNEDAESGETKIR